MRNPTRIGEMLVLIQLIWEKQPDTRFNQLIHNLQREYANKKEAYKDTLYKKMEYKGNVWYEPRTEADLFYVEDDAFLDFLQNKLKEHDKDEQ